MTAMRAKVRVAGVYKGPDESEFLTFFAVSKDTGYPEDGIDENNSFALWTPSAEFRMHVCNPALYGKFEDGKEYYVDFTPVN